MVRLYLAETQGTFSSPGARLFDVVIEGSAALDNYDVFARAGGANRAIVESVVVTADATVDVEFRHVVGDPSIKGLEVLTAT